MGGVYEPKQLRLVFSKKVNPHRVKLAAELVVDEANNSAMGLQAEYTLKQSTVVLGVDSNLVLKSTVTSPLGGQHSGTSITLCGEIDQIGGAYKFGYSIALHS